MRLEFELEVSEVTKTHVMYEVIRQGLPVGRLLLEDPYNNEKAIKRLLTMHNTFIKSESEVRSNYIKAMNARGFTNANNL